MRALCLLIVRQDNGRAMSQRTKQFKRGDIKTDGGQRQQGVILLELQDLLNGPDE